MLNNELQLILYRQRILRFISIENDDIFKD